MSFRGFLWTRSSRAFALAVATISVVAACGDDAAGPCTPGEQVSCACPGGGQGVQVCNAQGSGFEACACGGAGGNDTTSSASTSSGDAGGGGSAPCAPAEVEDCYDGPSGTQGVGICLAGTRICGVDGVWGACMGQVLPVADDCQTAADEDCDGMTPACAGGWALGLGNASYGQYVATDPSGNVFLMGQFDESVDFGGGNTLTDIGVGDLYVAKLSPTGQHLWSYQLGDPLDIVQPGGLETDSAGNLYMGFGFYGDPTILGMNLEEEGNGDAVLVRFLADGTVDWLESWGSTAFDFPYGLAIDNNDEPVVAVPHGGPIYFGGPDVLTPPQGTAPVALLKLDSAGGYVYALDTFPMGGVWATPTTDPTTNDVLLTGQFQNSFDLGMGVVNATTDGSIFLGRFDEAGAIISYDGLGGTPGNQAAHWIQASPNGDVTIGGRVNGALDLGQGDPIPQGSDLYYVARIDPSGAPVYVRTFPSNMPFALASMVRTSADDLLVIGQTGGNVDLGGGLVTSQCAFLVRYDATGAFVEQTLFEFPSGGITFNDIAVAPDGVPVVSGYYGGTITLQGTTLPDAPGGSAFVARLAP